MKQQSEESLADFGFSQVPKHEKAGLVAQVFSSVAGNYDLMNDLMSAGIHRVWKRYAIAISAARPGSVVLDLAGGTGDLSKLLASKVGKTGQVYLTDINRAMLREGRNALLNSGLSEQIRFAEVNAETIPFKDNSFDQITIGFGLRNVTDKSKALAEMYRVLKPGGQALILEFSHPTVPGLSAVYDTYSFKVLPWLGKIIANDADSYRYLAESIRMHPKQEALLDMMSDVGFDDPFYTNLTGGIVAIHVGYKY